ncbi:hypothetical protein G5B41_15865 [bacterium SGD-2]|nr:hypothetical protein [bacterium SGD-2]
MATTKQAAADARGGRGFKFFERIKASFKSSDYALGIGVCQVLNAVRFGAGVGSEHLARQRQLTPTAHHNGIAAVCNQFHSSVLGGDDFGISRNTHAFDQRHQIAVWRPHPCLSINLPDQYCSSHDEKLREFDCALQNTHICSHISPHSRMRLQTATLARAPVTLC